MLETASSGPSRRVLGLLVLAVLLLHLTMLVGLESPLSLQLRGQPHASTVHVRVVTPPPASVRAPVPKHAPRVTAPSAQQEPVAEANMADTPAPSLPSAPEATPMPNPEPQEPVREPAPATPAIAIDQDKPGTPWPLVSLGALPPSRVLSYQLTGMDKGLNYHASGELRWQHNATDYELTLAVRAFLIGRRQWRSVGRIETTGLAPVRFSDSWRNERAAHFDRAGQQIVFSSNTHPAILEPGAQDQISLYVQLAAAMAGEPERFAPGTRLQVQTATVRDAQPWSLLLEAGETMLIDGQSLKVFKWVCQPRNRYEARVEFWVAAEQAWLPLRIRITQSSGSFIDLLWKGSEPLPPLPAQGDAKVNNTDS